MEGFEVTQSLGQMTDREAFMERWAKIGEPFRPKIEKVLGEAINAQNIPGILHCHELLGGRTLTGRQQGEALGKWDLSYARGNWEEGAAAMIVNTLIDLELLDPSAYLENLRILGPLSFFVQKKHPEAMEAFLAAHSPREEDTTQALWWCIKELHLGKDPPETHQFDFIERLLDLGANPNLSILSSHPTIVPTQVHPTSCVFDHGRVWSEAPAHLVVRVMGDGSSNWHDEGHRHLLEWIRSGGSPQFALAQLHGNQVSVAKFHAIIQFGLTKELMDGLPLGNGTIMWLQNKALIPKMSRIDLHSLMSDIVVIPLKIKSTKGDIDIEACNAWWESRHELLVAACHTTEQPVVKEYMKQYRALFMNAVDTAIETDLSVSAIDKFAPEIQRITVELHRVPLDVSTVPSHAAPRVGRL